MYPRDALLIDPLGVVFSSLVKYIRIVAGPL